MWGVVRASQIHSTKISSEETGRISAKFCTSENFLLYGIWCRAPLKVMSTCAGICLHVTRYPPPLHTLYIPIVVGLLWFVRLEQADPLHISGTREEVANTFLQTKQALGYSINLPSVTSAVTMVTVSSPIGLGTHRITSVGRASYPLFVHTQPYPEKNKTKQNKTGDLPVLFTYV